LSRAAQGPPGGAPTRRSFLALGAAAGALRLHAASSAEPDAREFLDVPNPYRMRMHWFIFGPAWTAEECERELQLMAAAHIGGVLIFPAYPIALDDPARGIRNQPYLSPEFFDVLNAALKTCKKLGLTADILVGTGWPYGGPSVSVADSAKCLRRASVPVTAQAPVPLPDIDGAGKLLAAFYVDPSGYARLPIEKGSSALMPPATSGEVQFFYSRPTRMQVKRASLGAEGPVLDHYDAGALQRYLAAVGDKLLAGVSAGAIRSIFCDSFEVYAANWTDDLPEIFLRKRGYDLMTHLPALFDRNHADSRDLRSDFWRTLSEQAFDGFVQPLAEWAHTKGVTAQVESYGTPPVSLASYRAVDIPVGEHYEWKEFSSSRWASSGARLAGKRTVLAEAWTWLGDPNRFADTLEQLKLCSDLHFLSGINSLYGTSYGYSPASAGSPGWVPYFGPAINHNSPFWPYYSRLADYVNRASYILQQGKPVADIALYLPSEDAMAEADMRELLFNWAVRDRMSSNGPPPEFSLANALHFESDVVKTIITNGYSFDGVDTFAFREMRAEQGRLRSGDGDYAVLVLPNLTGIDVESLRKIRDFVDQGGIVIATRRLPETAYGMADRDQNRAEVERLVRELFGAINDGAALHSHRLGNGVAIFSRDERTSLLNALRWHPADIAFREASQHVGFVHRKTAERDYYFLANTSERPQRLDATFRVEAKQPENWDLRTGTVTPLVTFEHTKAGTSVAFELGPHESCVIAFVQNGRSPATVDTDLHLEATRDGWMARAFENRTYYVQERGGRKEMIVSGIPTPVVLAPRWNLRFEDASIAPVTLDELKSWTDIPSARFFSGRGTYEAEFPLASKLPADVGAVLDLGVVRETAEVWLNDGAAGVAWMQPYRLDVTRLLRMGTNRLRINVTNLLINRVLGMGPIDYSAVYERYGQRFPPGEEWEKVREPFPSGILGPVRLVFYKIIRGGRAGGHEKPRSRVHSAVV
jgi:hypothetical protein